MRNLRKEIIAHKFVYLFLGIILFFALFLRIYRINDLLGFYYDQGRDALVIWDLIKNGELFLIGPTTGLAGIFRGPYYYYLIAPFYFLGNGNPLWPSIFLSITAVLAILLGYYLGVKIEGRATGIIFAILSSFSFYIVIASRWLSNPTPMFFLSMILVWAMFKVIDGKKWGWPVVGLVSGLSLFNFGSSGELFYFVALFVFAIWQAMRRSLPKGKIFLAGVVLFFLTFAPLVLFDFIHGHILFDNYKKVFGGEKSFILPTKFLLEIRSEFYSNVFPKIIFHSRGAKELYALGGLAVSFILFLPKLLRNDKVKVLILLLVSAIVGLFFYQGNDTVLYEYYMTGYFLIFLLLVSAVLGNLWKLKLGQTLVIIFLAMFLVNNFHPTNFILKNKSDGAESISFVNQKEAIDWIYKDANGREFNVDAYVPPVIPYAYDYLFKWLGTTKYRKLPRDYQVDLLYTLYEVDPPHPERLKAWLDRQKGIGKVEETYKNGGITVERRERI